MANEIDALLARVDDPSLRRDLKTQFDRLRQKRQFGLVFEEHLPERVMLPQHPVRRGAKVVPRGVPDAEPRAVVAVNSGVATIAIDASTTEEVPTSSLVAIAEFGEPIYPGLRRLGSVDRGGDKPSHVVIKGENYHALEALQFTHAGKVDCIYIDPPYNTGARDWKYNNDFIDDTDSFRHSKWLAFIERRVRLAETLLNPARSVLVVTIDEHEVHNLGLLLSQVFPSARQQMVTIVNNAAGVQQGGFYRVDEYAIFCFFGDARPQPVPDDLLTDEQNQKSTPIWFSFIRYGGENSTPEKRPNLVYPIAVDPATNRVVATGRSLAERRDAGEDLGLLNEWRPDRHEAVDGYPVVWPYRADGSLSTWQASASTLEALALDGFVRVRPQRNGPGSNGYSISYVKSGNQKKVRNGIIPNEGREPGGGPWILGEQERRVVPKTVWKRSKHDAGKWGSRALRELLGSVAFDYAKSPYAVLDTLRTLVVDNPNAVVLDFFAGSGTTLQSLAMLNAEDGGRRQALLVTNNQVAKPTADRLLKAGQLPGDDAYEREGIFESVTRPRITAAISGERNGKPIVGDYGSGRPIADGFEENVDFVELAYLDAEDIELDMAFAGIAPLLWMRAGGRGPVIEERTANGEQLPFAVTDVYAVLFDPDQWRSFLDELPDTVNTVFVVTDSASVFAGVAGELPDGLDVVRLYENYLTTFAINQGGRR